MMVLTEDLGKMFEMAICLAYGTPYIGSYKYSLDTPTRLATRLVNLKKRFPGCKHIAINQSRYDFRVGDGFLSAKTTKGNGKMCPQVIGQPTLKKFKTHFNLSDNDDVKTYIMNNTASLLDEYYRHTFDCPIVYYNRKSDALLLVTPLTDIQWDGLEFSHVRRNKEWNESTTLYSRDVPIGEFQVHNHRDCIKFRWNFETLLSRFPDAFDVCKIDIL
jgi:hypothetical protein